MAKTTFARILSGKITLDRAIKHLLNRCGSDDPAVSLLEKKWTQLERERVHMVNTSTPRTKRRWTQLSAII